MKAKLVTASFMARVVVPDDATDEQIIEASKNAFIYKVNTELSDNVFDIDDDNEFPFGKYPDDYKHIDV